MLYICNHIFTHYIWFRLTFCDPKPLNMPQLTTQISHHQLIWNYNVSIKTASLQPDSGKGDLLHKEGFYPWPTKDKSKGVWGILWEPKITVTQAWVLRYHQLQDGFTLHSQANHVNEAMLYIPPHRYSYHLSLAAGQHKNTCFLPVFFFFLLIMIDYKLQYHKLDGFTSHTTSLWFTSFFHGLWSWNIIGK